MGNRILDLAAVLHNRILEVGRGHSSRQVVLVEGVRKGDEVVTVRNMDHNKGHNSDVVEQEVLIHHNNTDQILHMVVV